MAPSFKELWDEALAQGEGRHEAGVSIGGMELVFRSEDEEPVARLKEFLSRHLTTTHSPGVREHHILIAHGHFPDEPQVADNGSVWSGRMQDGTPVRLVRTGEGVSELRFGRSVSLLTDVEACRTLCLMKGSNGSGGEGRSRTRPDYLIPFLHFLFSVHNVYIIHAAGICCDDRSYLLLGPSGVGKTTASVNLACAGMAFMGDDLIAVEEREGALIAHALLFKAKVEMDTGTGKKGLDVGALSDIRLRYEAPLGGIVFLQRSPDAAYRFEPVARTQTLKWLLDQANDIRFMWRPREWFRTASAIADRIPGGLWSMGRPEDGVGHFVECITRIGNDPADSGGE